MTLRRGSALDAHAHAHALALARLLLDTGAVEVRPARDDWFTWASGKRAPIYCDNRRLISFPEERTRIADALTGAVRECCPDAAVVAGTATAGIPWAAWVAERLDLPMVYVRGSAKGHGRGRRVEGRPLAGERVALIEDLISTGGSSLDAVCALREEGGKVGAVVAIFTYAFPIAAERFAAQGIAWHTLSDYAALLEELELSDAEREALLHWRETF